MNSHRRTDGGDATPDAADDALDDVDHDILQFVSTHDTVSPGIVAFELDYDIGTVYDRLGELRRRGYLVRAEWSACSLSERGQDYLTDVDV